MIKDFELWFAVGMIAGALHAWILWRMSQPPFHTAAWHLPRFLLVGAILLASAISGGLLPAFAGWIVAYAAAIGIVGMGRTL